MESSGSLGPERISVGRVHSSRGAVTVSLPRPGEGEGRFEGTPKPNPEYDAWVAKDQMVLNYLLSNMYKEILGQVNQEITASGAWRALERMFSSSSRA